MNYFGFFLEAGSQIEYSVIETALFATAKVSTKESFYEGGHTFPNGLNSS